jgi:undecaprenyl-diphosphatase UppP
MYFLEILKVIFVGIVEGITEWLPISSTGHMLLVDEFLNMRMREEFREMFLVVIQLGAILAVIVIYWEKLWPFKKAANPESGAKVNVNKKIISLWIRVIIATIPAGIIGILLDDWVDEHMHKSWIIAIALIVYGAWFIWIEERNKNKKPRVKKLLQLSYIDALKIGLFQCLSIIPGTSRSGATIIGGLETGLSRRVAAEYTFFMGIPIMLGWSLVKIIKFGFHYSFFEFFELILGMAVAFVVSLLVIKFLMDYIKKHNFKMFGVYRIALGVLVLVVFAIKSIAG